MNAKNVARDVSEKVRKGQKVVMGEIMRKNGYSKSTSEKPKRVTQSKAFKEEVAPVLEAMIRERDRAIKLMKSRITKAKYRDLIDGADKLTKNIQLLQGKETGKEAVTFTWE